MTAESASPPLRTELELGRSGGTAKRRASVSLRLHDPGCSLAGPVQEQVALAVTVVVERQHMIGA